MSNDKGFWGFKAAVGAFLVIFVNLGACTTIGIFMPALAEYSGHSLGAIGQLAVFNTVGNVILSMVAIKVLAKVGARITMLISIVACAVHVHLYTFATPGANAASLAFIYAAASVASIAITFGTHAVCSSVIADWFMEKRESISGMVFSGAGFGAAIWVFAAGQLFRFVDYKNSYRILSVFILGIGLFAVIFLIKDPKKMGQKPLGWETAHTATGQVALRGVDRKTALKSPAYFLAAAAFILSIIGASSFIAYSPSWWQMNGMTSTVSANWNAAFLLIAGISLMTVGAIIKKFGTALFTIYVHIALILCAVCMLGWASSLSTGLMIATIVAGAIAYPINGSMPGLITEAVFGAKESPQIAASFMTFVYVGQMLMSPVMALFLATAGGMANAWKFFCVTAAAGMLLILLAIRMSPLKRLDQQK